MLAILVLINVAMLFWAISCIYGKVNVLKNMALAIALFFSEYAVVSGVFFWKDSFGFEKVLLSQVFANIILVVAIYKKGLFKKINFKHDVCVDALPIFLIVLLLPLTFNKFEIYGTGQDQGLYLAKAVELVSGNYENQLDFEEYHSLEEESDLQAYQYMVDKGFTGFYVLSGRAFPTVDVSEIKSSVSGMYHGIPTFPAILALWGEIFGLEKMIHVQSAIFLSIILLAYYILENLNISKQRRFAYIILLGTSPLLLWLSKTTLTELLLTLLIILYLYFVLEDHLWAQFLAVIPLLAFSYVHVSYLQILPLFVFINFWLYTRENNKQYLYNNITISSGMFLGYCMMSEASPQYFFDNLNRIYFGNVITRDNVMWWMLAITVIVIVISLIVPKFKSYLTTLFEFKYLSEVVRLFVIFACIFFVYLGYKNGFCMTPEMCANPAVGGYYGTGFEAFTNLPIFAYAMATGFVIVPLILGVFCVSPKTMFENRSSLIMGIMFLYTVIFQSCFIIKEIAFYYYYSRYLAVYVSVILILSALCLGKIKRNYFWIVIVISLISNLYFDSHLVAEKDFTQVEWETLLDLKDVIDENSAVVISGDLQRNYALLVRSVADCAIFPETESLEEQLQELTLNYSHVYYLCTDNSKKTITNIKESNSTGDVYVEYRDITHTSIYPWSFVFYPMSATKVEGSVELYQYHTKGIPLFVCDLDSNMVGVLNGVKKDGKIESTGTEGVVAFGPYCQLEKGEYLLGVELDSESNNVDDLGYVRISVHGSKVILEETDFAEFLVAKDDIIRLEIPFRIDEDMDGVEFVFGAKNGAKYKLRDYRIYIKE